MSDQNKDPERVLSLMAHPDDAEIFCAGTLALLQEQGFELHIATMMSGDCGSKEHDSISIAQIRWSEARDAAAKVRATYYCADQRDLRITYDTETIQGAGVLSWDGGPVFSTGKVSANTWGTPT